MSVAKWADRYAIPHWQIFWSTYRKLTWLGFEPTTTEFRSDTLTVWAIRPWVQLALRAILFSYFNFIVCSVSYFISAVSLCQLPRLLWWKFCVGNHMSVTEWANTYGIHDRRILWRAYGKLAWVVFEPMTSEFCSDALTDWAIRPWVKLALRANFLQLLKFHCVFSVTFDFGLLPLSVATFILIEVFCR